MPRRQVNQFSEFPYHICGRVSDKKAFPLPLKEVWEIFEDDLFFTHHLYGLQIQAFVLMPNHFHLIAQIQNVSISKIMNSLMLTTAKEINWRAHRINHLWGGRHHKTELNSYHYLMNCYKYVYQNPVRAKMVNKVEDWPYSTLSGLLGRSKLVIPVVPDQFIFPESVDPQALDWLNKVISEEDIPYIRQILTKQVPTTPRMGNKRIPHRLERELL